MSSAQSIIPEITDEDIDWVCSLIGLVSLDGPRREFLKSRSTVDVSACPGSGKTTLIVAKLAILARKWPYRAKGICVLSHTNVAREEIQRRLSGTVVGQRLLGYPHFIDTIHGFVNRFLALPWLYSNGFPVVVIDDDVTTGYRRSCLGQGYQTLRNYLQRIGSSLENLRITGRDFTFDLRGRAFPASPTTDSFQLARQAIEASAKAGYFCHEEMFVWAKALLEDHPDAQSWLARRFPLVIVDEMQDTSERQGAILNAVFPRCSKEIVFQRVGDPNQAIFDSLDTSDVQPDPFPDPTGVCMEISSSYRFGPEIASLSSPFAIRAVLPSGLCGIGPKTGGTVSAVPAHSIFLFPDGQTEGVLDVYGKHVLDVLPASMLEKGLVTAVGAIHKNAPHVAPGHAQFPKTVSHYWAGYRAETSRRDLNPGTLAQYLWMAQALAREGSELYPGVDKIASGFVRLADLIGDTSSLKRKTRAHGAIMDALKENTRLLERYQRMVRMLLIDQYILTESKWKKTEEFFASIARALCKGPTDLERGESFLAWPEGDALAGVTTANSTTAPGRNVYRVTEGDQQLDIRLGSIHSVKGQTHIATLVLNTFWYEHSFNQLLPWLLGKRVNGDGINSRDRTRLLLTYVAMTRPSHLLCLAMQRSVLGDGTLIDERIARLKRRGWRIAELVDGVACWKT